MLLARSTCLLVLLLTGCRAGPSESNLPAERVVGDLTYSAQALVIDSVPTVLRGSAWVRSRSSEVQTLEYDGPFCWPRLRLYRSENGRLAWDSDAIPNPDPETGVHWACWGTGLSVRLQPHDVVKLDQKEVSIQEVLGDSLPAGSYRVTLTIRASPPRARAAPVTLELAAGSVTLRSLPSERLLVRSRQRGR